jgi:3-hydroxybutyryl-CoA dehydrogenase
VVIGAGTMGLGIAYVAAGAGYTVELVEPDSDRLMNALAGLDDLWEKAVSSGKMSNEDADECSTRIVPGGSLNDVAPGVQVVVEAVPERLALKQQVLAAAEALDPVVLSSNTSSIAIGSLASGLSSPERFCGLHFFNPVWAMPLVEIVMGPATAPDTVTTALAVAGRLGKEPIVVRDAPGFATSRLGVALGLEAIRMVEDGVASVSDIDKAMRLGYRHPMGPLELTDVVGLDVRLDIARTLAQAYGPRFEPPALLESMVAQGKLGKKSGEGFYRWENR